MRKRKIFAVIAAHNEARTIAKVVRETSKEVAHVIVVDDGSVDKTSREAGKAGALVLRHRVNLGKGAALKTGCDAALLEGAQTIIALDADLQHDPKDIPRFLQALKGKDIVFGCRRFNRQMPLVLRFGNRFISTLTKILYGVGIEDTQSGYRAFTAEAYRKIRWRASDYSMESEMIALAGRHRLRYRTIPIKTSYPDRYKGTTVLDGIKIVFNLMRWRLWSNGG